MRHVDGLLRSIVGEYLFEHFLGRIDSRWNAHLSAFWEFPKALVDFTDVILGHRRLVHDPLKIKDDLCFPKPALLFNPQIMKSDRFDFGINRMTRRIDRFPVDLSRYVRVIELGDVKSRK